MLTDEDLTRQLRDALGDEGAGLRYGGRVPRVRRVPAATLITVPAVAAVGTAVILAGSQGGGHPATPPGGEAAPTAHSTSTPTPRTHSSPRMVTDTIKVAGYTFTYRHPANEPVPPDDIYADLSPGPLPADATPVSDVPDGTKAWVATQPESGKHALYVQLAGGDRYALVSSTWTTDQLSRLLFADSAIAVPAIN